MSTRQITPDELQESLVFIRDNVLTDETITTFFGAVDKVTNLFHDVYFGIQNLLQQKNGINQLEESLKSRDLDGYVAELIKEIKKKDSEKINTLIDDDKSARGIPVSFDGVLEAILFIAKHVKTTGSILDDVYKVVSAVSTIERFEPSNVSNGEKSRSANIVLASDLDTIYRQFA